MEENINFLIYKENIVDLHNLILNDNTCWLLATQINGYAIWRNK